MTQTLALGSHPIVICGTCGVDNALNLTFCRECGQRLGPRVAAPTPPVGLVASPPVAAASGENRCARCGGANRPGVRYCVTCGNSLDAPAPPGVVAPFKVPADLAATSLDPVALVAPQAPPVPAAPLAAPFAATALPLPAAAALAAPALQPAQARGADAGATRAPRVCPRCRGIADDVAQFCRFCGAALEPPETGISPSDVTAPRPSPTRAAPVDQNVASFWRPPVPHAPLPSKPDAGDAVIGEAPAGGPAPAGAAAVAHPSAEVASAEVASAEVASAEARRTAAPPPTPVAFGRLVVINKDGGEGASYPLREQLDIGRTEGDVQIPDDPYLSPRHVRVVRRSGAGDTTSRADVMLVDLGSTNGVYLRIGRENGREVVLQDQDLFLVGQQVLKFQPVRDADEGLGPAMQHGTLVFGTPSATRYARVSQMTVEGVARDVFHLHKVETVLGRESGDIVFTDDPFLSRRHVSLTLDPASRRCVLTDLGSSNGTFVQIRGEVSIKSGDQFRIGQQLFRVELNAASAP